jgi:hypothetical protein
MRTRLPLALTIGAVAALCGLPAAGQAPSGAAYTLTPVTYGMQLKTPDGRVVFDYMTKKPPMSEVPLTSPSVACFHPVLTPSGERVTALAPDDHPHHRGIYLAWHDSEFRSPIDPGKMGKYAPAFGWGITTADFWGWGEYAPRDNRIIQTNSIKLAGASAAQAEIAIENAWMVGKRKLLDETTATRVSERDGAYVMDFTFTLAPVVDYVLHKQSFSGFNFQGRKDGESYFTNSAGTVQLPNPHYSVPELNWPPAPWYGYVVKVPSGKVVGAAVIDHPSNPPSTWHNARNLWMVNPVIAALGPVTIRPGSPLTLRYRVVVHDGPTPTAVVEKLAAEFRGTK